MSSLSLPTSDIINFWFGDTSPTDSRSLWFDKSPDCYLTEMYKNIVDSITLENYKKFIYTPLDQIALLIIGDQFTRNIYRNDPIKRLQNDVWTLPLAIEMIYLGLDLTLPLNYRYFILLPLRHNKSSSLLDIVCSRIKLYQTEFSGLEGQIKRHKHQLRRFF